MKTDVVSKMQFAFKTFILVLVFSTYFVGDYLFHNYMVYRDIGVYVSRTATIEYGSNNYDIKKIVKEVEGEIISVRNDIDTSVLGEQEVLLDVKKGNVVKTVPVMLSIVDVTLPMIELNSDHVSITSGEEYNLLDNINYVRDDIDGDLIYSSSYDESEVCYYTLKYDDYKSVGNHDIVVYAIDSSGNSYEKSFTLEVKPAPVIQTVYYNLPPNVHGGDLVAIAYSLVGAPYAYGGTGQNGFDCSGFVQYVYSTAGIMISRSTSTQLNEGKPVSLDSAQPGDILVWGANGDATHSALYVGDGKMIHASNPTQGVIVSDINFWRNGSGTSILSVRRIQ